MAINMCDSQKVNRQERIEEYKEAGLDWRHDDQGFWRLTRLFLPLSFGALVLPYFEPLVPIWFFAIAGITLMSFWYMFFWHYAKRVRIRFKRMHQIEGMLGFNYHLKYAAEMNKNPFKFRLLYTVLFIGYIVLWAIVLTINYCAVNQLPTQLAS